MAQPEEKSYTVADLYRLPDDGRQYELSRGRLVSEPLPGFGHGLVATRIGAALSAHAQAHRVGVVVTCDTGFVLSRSPDTVRGPDVAFVTWQRYQAIEDKTVAFEGPPDLAVEVLSPGARPGAVDAKVKDYLDAGTSAVWVIDPRTETIRVYAPRGEAPSVLGISDELSAPEIVPGFHFPVCDLFCD